MRKVYIVEGSQGVGKGTITNLMREQMPYTNLLRLSGINDKTEEGKSKVFSLRYNELQMIQDSSQSGVNFILDRSHLSETIYSRLGFKEYSFEAERRELNNKLGDIARLYEVYLILLVASKETFSERLKRDKPKFQDLNFTASSSIKQQEEYMKEFNIIATNYPEINCISVNTDFKTPEEIVGKIMKF